MKSLVILVSICAPLAAQETGPGTDSLDTNTAVVPREFGRVGLAIKVGEAAGAMGLQVGFNFSRHLQLCGGVGGVGRLGGSPDLPPYLNENRSYTDSYFLLGKGYWEHLYIGLGYSLKVSRTEKVVGNALTTSRRSEHGLPLHIGYEFGHRKGFFFTTSIGYLYVFGGGNRNVAGGATLAPSSQRTVKSGPSLGMSIGYYLW